MSEPVGIIYPPQDVRRIVDSTATYVAKNGEKFEERIKKEHRDKPKFSFLLPNDPFNAYYQHKVKEIRTQLLEGLESSKAQEQNQDDRDAQQEHQPASTDGTQENASESRLSDNQNQEREKDREEQYERSHSRDGEPHQDNEAGETSASGPRIRSRLNEYIQEMSVKLEEPEPLNYLAHPAPNLTQSDCDIIKLTAQYIATHGRSFLLELVSREQTNSQFDFLKPQHGQFTYMTNLIMQYALVQNQPLDIMEQLNNDAFSQKHVLERVKNRAEWNRMLETERKKKEEAEENEKLLYSQIDWHDFVIKETIDYQPDERGEYPPTTADQVGTRLLLQQRYEEQNVPEEMEIDMEMDSDQEESDGNGEGDKEIVIKKDYNPKLAQPNELNFFISPITNERIPIDKIDEHVRYNLAGPKMNNQRIDEENVFASGSQIQESLKSLAERRTDIFGQDETAIGKRIGEEEDIKDDRAIWDGHKSGFNKKKKLT